MTKNETETRKHIPLNKLNTVAKKQWIKCTIWSIIYILFIVWVGNFWWLFLLPFIFDLFITKYIPYDWWKKYKTTNKTLYTICSWVIFVLQLKQDRTLAVRIINKNSIYRLRMGNESPHRTEMEGRSTYLYLLVNHQSTARCLK